MTDIIQRLRCTVPCADMTAKAGCHCAEAADTIAALTARVEQLERQLKRLLLEFDFMVESKIIPDVRNDIIFVEARAALTKGESNG